MALIYPSREAILQHCTISEVEERLLRSVESPIVILRRAAAAGVLAASVAPGNPYLGVMLPYTPLHWLLMDDLKFPVIATSGNLSDEPICIDEREALDRLRGIADIFLVHNRPIIRHVDDSIVREMAGREMLLRRARGFSPLPVTVPAETAHVLAVGAHQKNTVAISHGPQVFVSQHIGDLETAQAMQAFERVIASFETLYEWMPQVIACDMHPAYVSTQYAQAAGLRVVAVQHHYAHVLACMADNDLRPPVLGVAWDGSGYGPDGTVWGGEFLHVTDKGFERVAHLRTFRLPGGEKAVKEPRRVALALLYEALGAAAFEMLETEVLRAFSSDELRVLRGMLQGTVNSPVTSSAGRLFDGIASLIGLRQVCRFEGQAAMELEFAIRGDDARPYPCSFSATAPIVIDWQPMVQEILGDPNRDHVPVRFHETLAAMIAAVAERIGEPKVVCSGGCFQNRYLTESVGRHLSRGGFQPYFHQRVPPNDGGISLGQVLAANAAR